MMTEKKKAITLKDVIREYVKSRDEIERLEAELAEQLKEVKKVQKLREQWMLGELQKGEQESVRTDEGTVYRSVKESVKVDDWDSFLDFVRTNESWEFLNHAANKTACLEVMGERVKGKGRPNPPPKGISYNAFETVGVRRG
jgi:hypothetical protein